MVHGDDFLSDGPADSLLKMNTALQKNRLVKAEIIGSIPGSSEKLEFSKD